MVLAHLEPCTSPQPCNKIINKKKKKKLTISGSIIQPSCIVTILLTSLVKCSWLLGDRSVNG